ncbi:hypothetical protein ACF3M1_10785 [Luteimonas sp. WGS1318]|uniref:hypothetical protein n=1 Tax=Luteimonas sp. WGS1318 TaxID=3366815 RepID=UPI00372D4C8F
MSRVVIPLHPVEPQLTPVQEDTGFALMAVLDAAKAAGDAHAYLEAVGPFLDWQMSVGLLTREQWRRMTAPRLLSVIQRADEIPEGRELLQKIRDDALEAVNGDDYSERAAGALYILHLDGAQNARRHAAREERNREAREEFDSARYTLEITALNMWPCLESGYWALEDIEAHILQALRALNRASGDDA